VHLAPGARVALGFFGWFEPITPQRTAEHRSPQPWIAPWPWRKRPRTPATGGGRRRNTAGAPTFLGQARRYAVANLSAGEIASSGRKELRHATDARPATVSSRSYRLYTTRTSCCGPRNCGGAAAHGELFRTGDRRHARRGVAHHDRLYGRSVQLSADAGDVSINRCLSATLSVPRPAALRRPAPLRRVGWRLRSARVPSAWEVPATRAAGSTHTRRADRSESQRRTTLHCAPICGIAGGTGPPVRFLLSNHIAPETATDGAEAVPVRSSKRPRMESSCGRFPSRRGAPASPTGGVFRFDPHADTVVERVGGDEVVFAMAVHGRSRFSPC